MRRELSPLILLPLLIGLGSGLLLSANTTYYITTSSPQYSVLPDSQFVEPLPSSQDLPFAVILNFTNYSSLYLQLNAIISERSPYLSPSQFRHYYYPTDSYKRSLEDYLRSYGIRLTGDYGLILTFNGTVGQIERAFNTHINIYYYPLKDIYWFGEKGFVDVGPFYYFTNNVTPSLPYSVGEHVLGIIGIDNLDPKVYQAISQPWHLNITSTRGPNGNGLISKVLVLPNTLQQYFNFTEAYDKGKTGEGSVIAIEGVPESYINESDAYYFWSLFSPSRTGALSVFTLGNDTSSGQSGENELDVEYSGAFAPSANVVLVFSDGYVGGQALVGNLLNYYYEYYIMANYINPTEVSISVTLPESFLAAYYPAMLYAIHNLMVQFAEQGTSVLAASGDWGYETDHHPPNFVIDTYNTIWYPESDPLVTSVGGIFINASASGSVDSISGWDYSTGVPV